MVQFLFSSSKMDDRHVNTILCSWEAIWQFVELPQKKSSEFHLEILPPSGETVSLPKESEFLKKSVKILTHM